MHWRKVPSRRSGKVFDVVVFVYRLSRRFDCLAGSAFSRVSAEIDRTSCAIKSP